MKQCYLYLHELAAMVKGNIVNLTAVTLQAPYPDPKDAEAWNKQPMWPAALASASNLSYDQQYKALIEIMKKLGISTVKVTHTWRVAGAQAMDAAGVDDSVSFWHKLSCQYQDDCNDANMLGMTWEQTLLILVCIPVLVAFALRHMHSS